MVQRLKIKVYDEFRFPFLFHYLYDVRYADNNKPLDYFVVSVDKYLEIKAEINRRLKQKIVTI